MSDHEVAERSPGEEAAKPHRSRVVPSRGGPPPKSYMMHAVLSLFGTWPLGVVAIVFAHRSRQKLRAGDKLGAKRSGEAARNWAAASWAIGVFVLVTVLLA